MYQRTDVSYQLLVTMWGFHEIIGMRPSHITTHWAQYMTYISVLEVSSGTVAQWLRASLFWRILMPMVVGSNPAPGNNFFFFKTCIWHAFCIQEHGKCIVQQDSTCSTRVLWLMAASKGSLPDFYWQCRLKLVFFNREYLKNGVSHWYSCNELSYRSRRARSFELGLELLRPTVTE